MRVLILSEASYPRHSGGGGKAAHLEAAGLVARGHTVHLVGGTAGATVREALDGVDVHRVWNGLPVPRAVEEDAAVHRTLSYLEREIPLREVDVVLDAVGFLSFYYRVGLALRERYGIPLAVHFLFVNLGWERADPARRDDPFSPGALRMERGIAQASQCLGARAADLVIAPSLQHAALLRELFAVGAVAVVPNPARGVEPDPARVRRWRERLGGDGERRVLFAGRIGNLMKGGDVVRMAFRRLAREEPRARLVVMGEPAAAGAFGRVRGRVSAVGWQKDDDAVAAVMAACDVLLMPSRYEPFGMTCAEAMLAGLPVVASPVGGLREMVRPRRSGLLLGRDPGRWVGELAAHAGWLLAHPHEARRMAAEARRRARARYTVEHVAAALESLLLPLAAKKGRLAPPSPPRLRGAAAERYLQALATLAGATGREAGVRRLAAGSPAGECSGCTRGRIAAEAVRLVRAGARAGADDAPAHIERAIVAACPVGVLQRAALSTGLRASSG